MRRFIIEKDFIVNGYRCVKNVDIIFKYNIRNSLIEVWNKCEVEWGNSDERYKMYEL